MPTFEDPRRDADELEEAARGLAHASRTFADPADTYYVLGDLRYALTSIQQSLSQVATWHGRHLGYAAADDGDREVGREHAEKTAAWANLAAVSLSQVADLVMRAQSENGTSPGNQPPPHSQTSHTRCGRH